MRREPPPPPPCRYVDSDPSTRGSWFRDPCQCEVPQVNENLGTVLVWSRARPRFTQFPASYKFVWLPKAQRAYFLMRSSAWQFFLEEEISKRRRRRRWLRWWRRPTFFHTDGISSSTSIIMILWRGNFRVYAIAHVWQAGRLLLLMLLLCHSHSSPSTFCPECAIAIGFRVVPKPSGAKIKNIRNVHHRNEMNRIHTRTATDKTEKENELGA